MLGLRRDALTQGQVRAIRNLVASATPGLTTSRVTILDETGRLLAAASSGEDGEAADGVDARQAATEDRIRRTVTDIVEGVVGVGNARVQVTAEMDFNRVTESRQTYDPEGRVVRSTQSSEGTSSSAQSSRGVTAGANVPDTTAAQQRRRQPQIPTAPARKPSITKSPTPPAPRSARAARIRRLSVAVAVDGVVTPAAEAGAEAAYAPRSAEEMQRLTQLVRSAVGFSEPRGDVVEVVNAQFARIATPESAAAAPGPLAFLGDLDVMRIVELVATLLASLAFVFFVLRPLVSCLGARRRWRGRRRRRDAGAAWRAAALAAALPGGGQLALPEPDDIEPAIDIAQIQGRVRASSVKRVAEVIDKHPDESVQIIRSWLNNAL